MYIDNGTAKFIYQEKLWSVSKDQPPKSVSRLIHAYMRLLLIKLQHYTPNYTRTNYGQSGSTDHQLAIRGFFASLAI